MNTLLALLLSAMLGHWLIDTDRLPAFSYDAPLPFECKTPDGKTPQMREDPWFLLGNITPQTSSCSTSMPSLNISA